eukprot:16086-Pyramimonas_sp.AAC.1
MTRETKTEGEWVSFQSAASRDGETAVREMIAFGTMQCRPNPKLPPTTTLEWPYNQQVAYTVDKWSDGKKSLSTKEAEDPE